MIAATLWIFTVILIVIGGFCGFRRGILKEGVRVVLWGVLFVISCVIIPQTVDFVLRLIFSKADWNVTNIEQLVELCFSKVAVLKNETALILPLAGLLRSLLVPVVSVVHFWITGLISFVAYLVIAVFLKKKPEDVNFLCKAAGAVLGIAVFLFAGAITIYPIAAISSAIQEGDYDFALQETFDEDRLVANAYEEAMVSKLYQYTGTEKAGKAVHTTITSFAVEEECNIWRELPVIIRFGNEGWKLYGLVYGNSNASGSMQRQVSEVLETFFAMGFISDENQLHLLKNIKNVLVDSIENSDASELLALLEVNNKAQFINDMCVLGTVYDILKQEGILEELLAGNSVPYVEEKTVNALLDSVYELSNADVVVPEVLNLLYASALEKTGISIDLSDMELTEEAKAELSEVVSVVNEISEIPENIDNVTEEEKEEILDALQSLEDNSVITKELLEELIDSYNIP